MKNKISIFFASFLVFISYSLIFANELTESQIKTSAECDICKSKIEKNIKELDGVTLTNLDVKSKILNIKYDSTVISISTIRKAISQLGYDADSIPKDKIAYQKLHSCCKIQPKK